MESKFSDGDEMEQLWNRTEREVLDREWAVHIVLNEAHCSLRVPLFKVLTLDS